jgi:pimeloyl-ACP methyl ester carboxylesterase
MVDLGQISNNEKGNFMPSVKVKGQNIYFEDSGGDGPALIFSHGLLMDSSMFEPQVAALKSRYRCIAWDERGHGLTATGVCAPFSYYDSADDLAALLAHLGIKQAVLIGMSQGGYLSLRCALTHPEIVRALVLINTQALPEDPVKMSGYQAMVQDWAANGLSEQAAAIVEYAILGEQWPGAAVWRAKWKSAAPADLLRSFQALSERDDISEQIKRIDVPALVIHSDGDRSIALASAKAMADALPDAEFVVVPGAGHASNLTHPQAVNPAIDAFLTTLAS